VTTLFDPFRLAEVTLANRIVVSPMCQYSAHEGCAADWHLVHWGQLLQSGAGLMFVEATAVTPEGRISAGCLGLWDDACERALTDTMSRARRCAAPTPVAIQLAHAGRKASSQLPWEGGRALRADEDPWPTVSASALAFDDGWHVPEALDEDGMARVTDAFVLAARRAVHLGFEVIELHSAHGYLLHQFLSPLSNRRDDGYGGPLADRMRFPLEVLEAVSAVVPPTTVLGMRISATDWVEGGWIPVAPSAVPYAEGDPVPAALDAAGLERIRDAFASAARRAHRAGIDVVEIHMAHGYLLHEFLSPLSNRREDRYGGGFEGRTRFPLEVFDAVRATLPRSTPVGVRLSATDWVDGGWTVGETVALAGMLGARGCAFVDVSSAGISPHQQIESRPGLHVPFARAVRHATKLPTIVVGLISEPAQADAIVSSGDADLVALARGFLWNPRWAWHAAAALGATVVPPEQYLRAAPQGAAGVFVRPRR